MLHLPADIAEAIREHARQEYPHECCGFLVGRIEGDDHHVLAAVAARNAHPESQRRRDRFTIDPAEFYRVEKEARQKGHAIIGFYHSHPDHPARPSATDREWAHPVYSYVIVAVHQGVPVEMTSWQLVEGSFAPEPVATR
jgi:proteasome lid subunit RPN8/RPN11